MDLVDQVKDAAEPLTDGKLDWRDVVSVARLLALVSIALLQFVAVFGGPSAPSSEPPAAAETDTDG